MRVILLSVCVWVGLLGTASCGDKPDVYDISIPNLKASPDETIVSLEISVRAGSVQSISNIPIGWQVTLDNDANWVSRIKARSTLGAASLAPDEVHRLVINVRRNEFANFKFDISGSASLAKTFDNRKLALTMEDFALKASS